MSFRKSKKGVFPVFLMDLRHYFGHMSPKRLLYRIVLILVISCQCCMAIGQEYLSGEWTGRLIYPTNAASVDFSLAYGDPLVNLAALAKLEWSSPSKYLEIKTSDGQLTNEKYDSATGLLRSADITFDLTDVQHAIKVEGPAAWSGMHFTALITATDNGFEMRGAWPNGSFYCRKKYTSCQGLLYALSLEIPGWIKRTALEEDAAYTARLDALGKKFDAFVTTHFRRFVGGEGLKVTYDNTTKKFTIDPIIADAITVDVPPGAVACFEASFRKWAADNLVFTWDRLNNTATIDKLTFKMKCDKKTYWIAYPNPAKK